MLQAGSMVILRWRSGLEGSSLVRCRPSLGSPRGDKLLLCAERKAPWCGPEPLNQEENFQPAWPISESFKLRIDTPKKEPCANKHSSSTLPSSLNVFFIRLWINPLSNYWKAWFSGVVQNIINGNSTHSLRVEGESCCLTLKRQLCVTRPWASEQHTRSKLRSRASRPGRWASLGRGPGSTSGPSGSLRDGEGDQGTWPRCRMRAGCTPSPSLLLGLGLWCPWAVSRGLCPVFPSFLPPALFLQTSSSPGLHAGCGGSRLSSAMVPPSMAAARSSPQPCPGAGQSGLCTLPTVLLSAGQKAGLVPWGLSRCSSQDLPVAGIWEAAVSLPCTFQAFLHVASEDLLSLVNIFIL